MIFHWVVFVSGFIVAVAGGVSKTLDTLQWGWDNTVLANISVAWVIINMVPFGMALGYAYLPHNKNVHGLLVSLSWTIYAMCATRLPYLALWGWRDAPRAARLTRGGRRVGPANGHSPHGMPAVRNRSCPPHAVGRLLRRCVLFCVGAMLTKVAYGNPKFM